MTLLKGLGKEGQAVRGSCRVTAQPLWGWPCDPAFAPALQQLPSKALQQLPSKVQGRVGLLRPSSGRLTSVRGPEQQSWGPMFFASTVKCGKSQVQLCAPC